MKTNCAECKAVSVDGVIPHKDSCRTNLVFVLNGGYVRPPTTEITFDSETERKEFMDGLNSFAPPQVDKKGKES